MEEVSADLLDSARNPVPMERAKRLQGAKHNQDERALQNIGLLGPLPVHLETYRSTRIGRRPPTKVPGRAVLFVRGR
jgi:hypothetical protein